MMELRKINKKGQVSGMAGTIISLGVAAIVLVLMIVILQEMRDTDVVNGPATANTNGCNATDTTLCGEAWQASNETVAGIGTFGDFWTIIVLAVVAAVVIGIIFGAFGGLSRKVR